MPVPTKVLVLAAIDDEVTVTSHGGPAYTFTLSINVNCPESKVKSSSMVTVAFAPRVKRKMSSPLDAVVSAAPVPRVNSVPKCPAIAEV